MFGEDIAKKTAVSSPLKPMVVLGPKFKLYAKLVLLCIRLCKQSVRNFARSRHQYESVLRSVDECATEISWDGHIFYPGHYCTEKPQILSSSARRILKQDPRSRSDEDIEMLLVALRNIPALNEYPRNMQQKLCKLGRYETFEPWRVLVREGDPAYCFYFILSGSVVVTAFDDATGSSRTLVILTKGMSFGELAFAANSRRQATVCSKTHVELLTITREEFEELFMDGRRDVLADDQNNQFIRGLNFLRHWPVERLKGNPQVSTVYYFDRNQVLVRDSNKSEWIYVVLKGSLSVLKKLPRLEPQPSRSGPALTNRRRRKRPNLSLNDINDIKREKVEVRPKTLRAAGGPDPEESFKTQFELETKLNQTLPGYYNINERLRCLDYDKIITRYQSKLVAKATEAGTRVTPNREPTRPALQLRPPQSDRDQLNPSPNRRPLDDPPGSRDLNGHYAPLPGIGELNKTVQAATSFGDHDAGDSAEAETGANSERHSGVGVQDAPTLVDNKETRQRSRKLGISHTLKCNLLFPNHHLKGAYLAPSRFQEQPPIDGSRPDDERQHDYTSPRRQNDSPRNQIKPEDVRQKLGRLQMEYQRRFNDREGRRTIAEDLDHKARRDYVITETDLDPMFIEVQVLERGQYFGITPLLFHDEPCLSVVSNGAECLVVSKKHFMAWANDKCLRYLRQTESPYPRDIELSRKLQEAINWRAHRAEVYQMLERGIRERQARRKQFLPAYSGQYCFRTGPA
ncbi:unnamed protein product [Lymnaea stagnalis]|uniref:Cyclic nucleotide-binding domain-containing protein n=1 Tax=Lymnaea stagnalis TaxID=6523 RepID=A0AAV2HE29_LYMST